jgi:hypothetical protein
VAENTDKLILEELLAIRAQLDAVSNRLTETTRTLIRIEEHLKPMAKGKKI